MKYRVKEIKYKNHTEYWCERSIRIFGLHICWERTTGSYYSHIEDAQKDLEDRIGSKETIVYYPFKQK